MHEEVDRDRLCGASMTRIQAEHEKTRGIEAQIVRFSGRGPHREQPQAHHQQQQLLEAPHLSKPGVREQSQQRRIIRHGPSTENALRLQEQHGNTRDQGAQQGPTPASQNQRRAPMERCWCRARPTQKKCAAENRQGSELPEEKSKTQGVTGAIENAVRPSTRWPSTESTR